MSQPFSCFIVGEGTLPVQCAEILRQRGHTLYGLISPDPTVQQWARDRQIPFFALDDLQNTLGKRPFDYLFSIVNNHIIPPDVLTLPQRWPINYHDAPLPRYAGSQATSWALLNQETMHGISWHIMTGEIDAGDILKQFPVAITPDDTALTLNAKCYYAAIQAFSELVEELATDRARLTPQDLSRRTYFSRFQRPPAAAIISWQQSARILDCLVRALNFGTYQNPLALPKVAIGDTFLVVTETTIAPETADSPPGTITAINHTQLRVKTADADLCLSQLLTPDGRPLTISEVVGRFGLAVGYQLPPISPTLADYITVINNAISRHETAWVKRLSNLHPIQLPYATHLSAHTLPHFVPHATRTLPPATDAARLTAVFAIYLARLSGIEQFHMGFSGAAQRQLAWIDQLFAVQMPLQVRLQPEWNLNQIETAVAQEMAATQKWHSYVLDIWARYPELRTATDTPHTLPAMVAVVNQLADFRPLPGCVLTLVVAETEGLYQLIIDQNAITSETAERIQAQFDTLLADTTTHPQKTFPQWQLLPADEWHQVVQTWNETAVAYNDTRFVHQIFEAQAAKTPNAPALVFADEVMTYAELNGRANQLARYLQQEGVRQETPVGIYMERSFEMVIAIYAILKAGGAYVPLDPSYPSNRLAYMISSLRPPIILTQSHLANDYKLPITNVLALDLDWSRMMYFSQENLNTPLTDDCLVYIIYTSGSTGQPKGVMNVHGAIRNRLLWMQATYPLNASDRVLQKTPYSFDVSVWEFLWPLMYGAGLVIARPEGHKDSNYLVETINRHHITTLHFVPSMLQLFLTAPTVESCQSLRRVICSGEALPFELQQRFFDRLPAELHNLYGPTEAAIDVTFEPCSRETIPALAPHASIIGRPIANTQIYILDKYLNVSPVGVPGELYIGGINLARGYVGRPDLTGERFIPNPFWQAETKAPPARSSPIIYKTGDLCRWLPDGRIEYLGRIDFQVKIRGFRIELGEIETALGAHPAVREVVLTARPDRSGQQRLIAYLVLHRAIPTEELRAYLQKRLPDYMVPALFVVLSHFPLTESGKVNRRILPDPEPERPNLHTAYTPPYTDLEKTLADLWQQVLHLDPVGIHDNFFELGGDSIKGAVFINALQEKLKTFLYIVALFEAPTIARFAAYLQQNYAAALAGEPETPVVKHRTITPADVTLMRRLIPSPPPKSVSTPFAHPTRKNKTAVFVLAPPRSGSTLLRVMLAGHPALFAPPELDLLNFNTLQERKNAFSRSAALRLEGTIRALMEAKELTADEAKALMSSYEAEQTTTHDFYRVLQLSVRHRLLVDKSPAYALDLTTLRRAEASFEQPFYLHLQRHPYGMITSFNEVRLDQTFFLPKHPFTVQQLAELIWLVSQQNILEFLRTIPAGRQQVVKFEQLVNEPEKVMRQICDFLQLEWEEELIRPYQNPQQRMVNGLYPDSRMLGDVKFHTYQAIDPTTATNWQKQVKESFLSDLSWQVAEQMGYERWQPEPANQLDTLLANLDGLSEEDVNSLLNQMLSGNEA